MGMLQHVPSSFSVLGITGDDLCPFQIPGRKAIACFCGMLTPFATAVPLVFDGLLLEHHPKDS